MAHDTYVKAAALSLNPALGEELLAMKQTAKPFGLEQRQACRPSVYLDRLLFSKRGGGQAVRRAKVQTGRAGRLKRRVLSFAAPGFGGAAGSRAEPPR